MGSRLHRCENSDIEFDDEDAPNIILVDRNYWILSMGDEDVMIDYCPFCGIKLEVVNATGNVTDSN
jgi:hypothetical protein